MSDPDRAANEKRVELAKKISASIIAALNGSTSALIPSDARAAMGDAATLLVELARLSHAKFDMSPHDFPALVREVESLRSAVEILKRNLNVNGDRQG